MRVTVEVPASSANLGPGFDCLGLALAKYARFTFEQARDFAVTGCPAAYAGRDNLAYASFASLFDKAGREVPCVRLAIDSDVPIARGLGSSSTCIVGGLVAANAFLGGPFDSDELLQQAAAAEGHPDNVAAALYGGLTASFTEGGRAVTVPYEVHPSWRFAVVIPDYEVRTHEARAVLPKTVSLGEAVHALSHAVAMTRALAEGDERLFALAQNDVLHEPRRRELIADYGAVRALALESGIVGFVISGSGSTMLAATTDASKAAAFVANVREAFPGFEAQALEVCRTGARVL